MKIKVVDPGPDLDPDEVKQAIDLRSFVVPGEVIRGDRPVVVFCKWHNDRRTPNLHLFRDHGHCFACGTHVDIFDFLGEEYPGKSFPELVKLAAEGAAITLSLPEPGSCAKAKVSDDQDRPVKPSSALLDPEIAEKYHRNLGEKREWFRARGLSDALIDSEKLGHNGRAFTIPVWSRDGGLLTIRFRRDDSVAQKGPKYWGMEGFNDVVLFNAKALDFSRELCVVCEGELDALRLWDECLPAVSATNGAGAFNADLAAELWRVQNVVICYDSDEPGKQNGRRVAAFFPGRAKILDLSPVKDVTDWFREHDVDEFMELIEKAGASGVTRHWCMNLRGGFWK